MNSAPPIPETHENKWVSRILKLIFVVTALILILLTVLANMGGSNDSLKESVEKFASEMFGGRPAKIEKLVRMSFFPSVGIDAENIHILAGPKSALTVAKIGKFRMFMSFWNVVTRTPRISHLSIERFSATAGVLGAKAFAIEKVFIDHDVEHNVAFLRGNGMLGVHPWSFDLGLEVHGSKHDYSYMIGHKTPLDFHLADITVSGQVINYKADFFKIENFSLSSKTQDISGDLVLSALGKKLLKVKGTLHSTDKNSVISPDLIADFSQNRTKISGQISSENLDVKDLRKDGTIFALFSRLRDILEHDKGNNKSSLLDIADDLDLKLALRKIKSDGTTTIPALNFPLIRKDGHTKLGPIAEENLSMPPVLFLKNETDKTAHIVIQDGNFTPSLLDIFGYSAPNSLNERPHFEITCAMGNVAYNEDETVTIKDFKANLQSGSLQINGTIDAKNNMDFDVDFGTAETPLKPLLLSQGSYDFVQSSFKATSKKTSCAPHVQLQEIEEPEKDESDNPDDKTAK